MGFYIKKYTILLLIVIIIFLNTVKADSDCKIITNLDNYPYMHPSLVQNNSFVYNNFEFYLYTNEDNTTYSIFINNSLISNGIIENNFTKLIKWRSNTEYISILSIKINDDYYNYSNVRVFTRSITNESLDYEEDKDKISFTKMEFENYITVLKIKLFSGDNLGWIIGFILGFIIVRENQKNTIIEV